MALTDLPPEILAMILSQILFEPYVSSKSTAVYSYYLLYDWDQLNSFRLLPLRRVNRFFRIAIDSLIFQNLGSDLKLHDRRRIDKRPDPKMTQIFTPIFDFANSIWFFTRNSYLTKFNQHLEYNIRPRFFLNYFCETVPESILKHVRHLYFLLNTKSTESVQSFAPSVHLLNEELPSLCEVSFHIKSGFPSNEDEAIIRQFLESRPTIRCHLKAHANGVLCVLGAIGIRPLVESLDMNLDKTFLTMQHLDLVLRLKSLKYLRLSSYFNYHHALLEGLDIGTFSRQLPNLEKLVLDSDACASTTSELDLPPRLKFLSIGVHHFIPKLHLQHTPLFPSVTHLELHIDAEYMRHYRNSQNEPWIPFIEKSGFHLPFQSLTHLKFGILERYTHNFEQLLIHILKLNPDLVELLFYTDDINTLTPVLPYLNGIETFTLNISNRGFISNISFIYNLFSHLPRANHVTLPLAKFTVKLSRFLQSIAKSKISHRLNFLDIYDDSEQYPILSRYDTFPDVFIPETQPVTEIFPGAVPKMQNYIYRVVCPRCRSEVGCCCQCFFRIDCGVIRTYINGV